MKKLVGKSVLSLTLAVGVFSGSAFAEEGEAHQPTLDYEPTEVLYDASNEVEIGKVEEETETEPGEMTTFGRVTIPAATGRTELEQEGLRFYGYATTSATSFVTMVAVKGYLGKEDYAGNLKWYENKYNDNWMTSGSTSVDLGYDTKVGAVVGDTIIVQALHTVTTAFGTESAESAETYKPIFV